MAAAIGHRVVCLSRANILKISWLTAEQLILDKQFIIPTKQLIVLKQLTVIKQLTVLKELTVFCLQVNVPVCISGVSSAAAADVIKEFTDKVSDSKRQREKNGFFK
jgi:hypothetical protein